MTWIPVTQSLPGICHPAARQSNAVLAYSFDIGHAFKTHATIAVYDWQGNEWYERDSWDELPHVTHWQPLPEPPAGGEWRVEGEGQNQDPLNPPPSALRPQPDESLEPDAEAFLVSVGLGKGDACTACVKPKPKEGAS